MARTSGSSPLLEIRELHVYYNLVHAIQGVSLQLHEGEIITLIGANGAGKSSVLRSISGVVRPRRGDILYRGRSLLRAKPYQIARAGISQVPEGRGVFAHMTVRENLLMGATMRADSGAMRRDHEQVVRVFPRLGERAGQLAGSLSGGEQQMLAIGRAMMARPSVLLLDEPSLGLAPLVVKEIFAVIGSLREAGTTVLLVEQNARQALRLADRSYVMELGRIVMEGSASELLNDERIVRAYIGQERT